ncbi:hypothetical protein AK830_g2478 [Neonectria ditissima]|uniref:Asparagine synthetase domain-containing protein n=1 Tax=Neonectria ditissima TaxID=78410 RepID=A0A0P7BRU7_9HYPO|nr:hypothetical protein AK830_g2478 [Neonectria ditissima]
MTLPKTNGSLAKTPSSPSWILLTNLPIPSLDKALQRTTASGVLVYGQGAALSLETYSWRDKDAEPKQFSEWTTAFEVKADLIRLRTGAMNSPLLFVTRNTTTRAWAIGTDAFLLNVARSQWGLPTDFANPREIRRDGTTSFVGVSQLPAHSSVVLKKKDSNWLFTIEELEDPVFAALNPKIDDYDQAGSQFVSSLQETISELTKGETSIATLLSGGIDSGAITTFAVRAGLNVTAYSVGSTWGNEHEEAQELADFLGIPLKRIDLSQDDYLAAIPESMRALATGERERVDIALTITAVLRSEAIKEEHILTGYGNDLMLLGLPPDTTKPEALIQDIITEVDLARHSGEFNDYVARTWGKRISHPYWHQKVVQTALDIHPACKVYGGREKAFFRAAMEKYIPKSAAWRKKIGIHVGGGLQGGLDALFGGLDQKVEVYNGVFSAITGRLLSDPFATVEHLAPKPA